MGVGRYRAGEWVTLGQMGYTGAEDEGMWTRTVGDDWEGEEQMKQESPPPKAKPPPPKPQISKTGDKKTCRWLFESDDSSDEATPPPPTRNAPLPAHKGQPRPQDNPPQEGGGWSR